MERRSTFVDIPLKYYDRQNALLDKAAFAFTFCGAAGNEWRAW